MPTVVIGDTLPTKREQPALWWPHGIHPDVVSSRDCMPDILSVSVLIAHAIDAFRT